MNKKALIYFVIFTSYALLFNGFNQTIFASTDQKAKKTGKVEVINNPKNPIKTNGKQMKIVFKEELSIGKEDGDDNYIFGDSIDVMIDDQGFFYVTDFKSKKILKYSPEGKYVLTIGRKGEGPGEFIDISSVGFNKEGLIFVLQTNKKFISYFNKDGKYLHQKSVKGVLFNVYALSNGFYLAQKVDMPRGEDNKINQIISIGLFNEKFELIKELDKSINVFSYPSGTDESSMVSYLSKMISSMVFKSIASFNLDSKENIFLSNPIDYEIKVYSSKGELIKIIKRMYKPIRINTKDKKKQLESFEKMYSSMKIFSKTILEKAMRKVKFPKNKPPIINFKILANNWLFVIVDSIQGEYSLIDLFDENGKYRGQFITTVPVNKLVFKNGKAYSVDVVNDYNVIKRYSYSIVEE